MTDSKSNAFGAIAFVAFIFVLAVGGFFLTKHLTKDDVLEEEKIEESALSDEHKIDKEQEYIYFSNEKFISMEPDITYKDVTINLDTAETINQTLKKELDEIRISVKYISDNPLDPNRTVMYDGENIYSALERNYETYSYKEYISLIVKDYEFNCYDGSLLKSLKSYVYNVETGKLLLPNDLLSIYNTDMDKVKVAARTKLESSQIINSETNVELIKIDETINGLNDSKNYAVYIDKYGDLYISFIVKTTEVDYNENMKLN